MPLSEKQENGNLSTNKNVKLRINLKTEKPTNTLLILKLSKTITETELRTLFGNYGTVSQVFISTDGFILLEFTNVTTASEVLSKSKVTPIKMGNHIARLFFCNQTIDEYKSLSKPNIDRVNVTKVLHFLITNAVYAINVDILHKICSPHGKIVRIFIGKKNVKENSIEALIEFASDADAKSVKDSLHGNDIYSSCCSLSLCYSKIHKIFVEKNDSESFDYSIVPKAGLLGPPPILCDNPGPSYTSIPFGLPPPYVPPLLFPMPSYVPPFQSTYDKKPQNNSFLYYNGDSTIQETVDGVVIQCRNFGPEIGADNLFNLFCLYGNVEKVKIANENASVAYIQMSNREGAKFCKEIINNVRIFNKTWELIITTLSQVTESMPNNDPVHVYYSDFNNRFKSSFQGKSRVYCPSQTLHFFNVPSTFRAEEIADVFVSAKVKDPSQVVIFPRKSGSNVRGSLVTGLIEFDSVEEALEGVVMVNHTRLLLPQVSHPYHIKLAFSPAKISEQQIKSSSWDVGGGSAGSGGGGSQSDGEKSLKRIVDSEDTGGGDTKSARLS